MSSEGADVISSITAIVGDSTVRGTQFPYPSLTYPSAHVTIGGRQFPNPSEW
jgi:hypothetical protein